MKSPITQQFAVRRSQQQAAFMPFISAGDPDIATTCAIIRELADCGADLIEVGFPYSDPVADGPVIQASYTRALNSGFRIADLFNGIGSLTAENSVNVPLVGMVSYAMIFRYGCERFVADAREAGFAGLIVPDLPGDEANEFVTQTDAAGLDLIQLIAPTTPPSRAEQVLQSCRGFVYCLSVTGITGARTELPDTLQHQLQQLRTQTELPLAIGFGVNDADQVAQLKKFADGIIVGSAIVRHLEPLANGEQTIDQTLQSIRDFITPMITAAHS